MVKNNKKKSTKPVGIRLRALFFYTRDCPDNHNIWKSPKYSCLRLMCQLLDFKLFLHVYFCTMHIIELVL